MTDEQIDFLADSHLYVGYDTRHSGAPTAIVEGYREFARALFAAGASEGQAEPIYQIRSTNSGTWHDVDKERYYSTRFERRIVYTHDLNNRVLALEASLYLKDAEIAALRERIAAPPAPSVADAAGVE